MQIWETEKLFLFLLFFIPGFISMKVYDLVFPGHPRDFSKSWFDAIGYSSLNFALFSWLILLVYSGEYIEPYSFLYFFSIFLIMFIAPVSWPFIYCWLLKKKAISQAVVDPILKPWDKVFIKKEAYWVIAHLKDGTRIAGTYGSNSHSSSYPAEEQIYLEQVWTLDENGAFKEPVQDSAGVIIFSKEMTAIELFKDGE